MDSWLKRHALDNEGKASRTYVVTEREVVVAYYTLAVGCLNLKSLPRRLRHNLPEQVPVMVLGRLAVDTEHSGQGIGSCMLREALQRTVQVAEQVGIRALVVHAINDEAVQFYTRIGFTALPGEPRSLLMPIETIIRAFAAPEPDERRVHTEAAS
jgi:GNAT superfamily N-acetyltransferase